jgi:hypothetical protein
MAASGEKRFSHGITTIRDLKSAVAQYPDDAPVLVELIRDGRPFSTLVLTGVEITAGADPRTVSFTAEHGQARKLPWPPVPDDLTEHKPGAAHYRAL